MQFITSLFGGSGNTLLTALFALGVVIAAIVLLLWLLKALSRASGGVARGRNRRLMVVDSLALDPKRQLLIVRRDNVEHLILVGGPQDMVVETGIPVQDVPATQQPARRANPMAMARKPAPATTQPAKGPAPTPAPEQPAAPEPAAPVTAADRLRELGQPTNKRAHLSLRHTGLLRPVTEMEMPLSPENSPTQVVSAPDSAKEDRARHDIEGTQVVDDNSEANRN
ncbi:MAG TPA: flagellar biosynthetic protein FliO [Devosia sp.]|jgi:flagellar biogenesis protein FliO|nr:flagellar biosynthetic protein FliO [Devosia sp.]